MFTYNENIAQCNTNSIPCLPTMKTPLNVKQTAYHVYLQTWYAVSITLSGVFIVGKHGMLFVLH
jgi:hypothetical protein